MKNYFTALFLFFFCFVGITQNGAIVEDVMISASLDGASIPLKIYLPSGHSPGDTTYRVYIFLHGAGNSTYSSHVGVMRAVLDDLINDGTIDPIIVVWPNIQRPGVIGPDGSTNNFSNRHYYTDSYRSGNYESVIDIDLLNWLNSQVSQETYGFSLSGFERGIGGFSMGGRAAIRIAATNSQEFIVAASHCGVPALRINESFYLPYLLSEYPGAPPYNWNYWNGVESNYWFSASIAFSPDSIAPNVPDWDIDFPVHAETGAIIPEVFEEKWINNYDGTKLLEDLKEGNPAQGFTLPIGVYFDSRAGDVNLSCSTFFDEELRQKNISGYSFNIWPFGGHQLNSDAVEASLIYIDSIMDANQIFVSVTEPESKAYSPIHIEKIFPNPVSHSATVLFETGRALHVQIKLYDASGRAVKVLVESMSLYPGTHELTFVMNDLSAGIYTLAIESKKWKAKRQLVVVE